MLKQNTYFGLYMYGNIKDILKKPIDKNKG